MPTIGSNGIFGDDGSGGGLFRDVTPIDSVSRRESGTLFHDFINNRDILNYDVTVITSGSAVIDANSINGALLLSNSGILTGLGSVQFSDAGVDNAAAFVTAAADRLITFEVGVTLTDSGVTNLGAWFIGLGEVDQTFMGVSGALAANGRDNHVGFHRSSGAFAIPNYSSTGGGGTNQTTATTSGVNHEGGTISKSIDYDTYIRLGFRIFGTDSVEFYVNGELGHVRTMSNALDTAMTPTFTAISGGSTFTMAVDYLLVTQTR